MPHIFRCVLVVLRLLLTNKLEFWPCRMVYLDGRRGNASHHYENGKHIISYKMSSIPKMAEYVIHELVHVLQWELKDVDPLKLRDIRSLAIQAHAFTYTYSEDDQYPEFFAQYAALYATRFANR